MARARFLLRPRWLLSHLLVVALVILMVNLGFWQLRRLDERRALNDLIEGRMDEPVVAIDELVAPGDDGDAVEATRFRRVSATGTYDDDATVVVRNRSQDGKAGAWLVTPLTLAGGERVGVVRGFVGFADDGSIPQPAAPEGEVTVQGLGLDPGRLGGTAARDVEGLLAEDDGVLPTFVQAEASSLPDAGPGADVDDAEAITEPSAAAEDAGLVTVARPELGEGPHLGYAAQWFIFSTIAAGGYALILRRLILARGRPDEGADDGDDDAGDPLDREIEDLLREAR